MSDPARNAVLIIFMEDQWPATKLTLFSVQSAIPPDTSVALLLNGSEAPDLAKEIERAFPSMRLNTSKKNLGVAGGRNFLLATPEARNAEFIFHLDNDVILSKDYFDSMLSFLHEHPDSGVIGPLVFDAGPLLTFFFQAGYSAAEWPHQFETETILKSWKETGVPKLQFIGSNPDWEIGFLRELPRVFNFLNMEIVNRLTARHDWYIANLDNPEVINRIMNGSDHLRTSLVRGCGTLYSREVLDAVGWYDDAYNPYNYEDVDLCLRLLRAGYSNYVCTQAAIFHGTDMRAARREGYMSPVRQWVKGRALVKKKFIDDPPRRFLALSGYFLLVVVYYTLLSLRRWNPRLLIEALTGFFDAMRPAVDREPAPDRASTERKGMRT